MTGRDLIKWITDNHAEDMPVATQFRDYIGQVCDGELIGKNTNNGIFPCLAYSTETSNNEVCIDYTSSLRPNTIVM